MAKSVVSIVKGTDPVKMVEEALSLLGGVEKLIRPGSTVVIKPNAIADYKPERSITTSPAFISAVIKVLRKAKPKEIIMAEASAMSRDTMVCLEATGQKKAAEDAGIDRIVDIKREKDLIRIPIRDAKSDLTEIMLPRFLVEADHIVNLPIYKSHVSAVFSCSMKNIKGIVSDKVHYQMHQTNLADAMMDLWSAIKLDLQIVDMIRPLEGFGPMGGLPVDFGCVVAGKNPVAVDATCCRMVGLDIAKAPFFVPAHERGLGDFDEKAIEIRGQKIADVFKELWIPYLGGFEQWPEYKIYAKNACSSCQGLLAYSLERLKSLGEYDKNAGLSIMLGKHTELPKGIDTKNLILMGECVKKFRNSGGLYVGGCPPLEMEPAWSIMDRVRRPTKDEWARNYHAEVEVFKGYVGEMRDKAKKTAAKSKKK